MKNFLLYCTLLFALLVSSSICQETTPTAETPEETPEDTPIDDTPPIEENSSTNGTLRLADVENFRVTIYEDSQDNNLYVKAINLDTGNFFGPTEIYQNLNREIINDYISTEITLQNATDTQIELLLPLYESAVQLNLVPSEALTQVNLLTIKTDELSQENDALKSEVDALKAKQFFGKTAPEDWFESDGDLGVFVDISHLNLQETPLIFTALNGEMYHYDALGATSIYALSNTSFSVYLRWAEGGNMTTDVAVTNKWYLSYTVVSLDDMEA